MWNSAHCTPHYGTQWSTHNRGDFHPSLERKCSLEYIFGSLLLKPTSRGLYVELPWIHIMVAVAVLSRYLAKTSEGHLEGVFHLSKYLKAQNVSHFSDYDALHLRIRSHVNLNSLKSALHDTWEPMGHPIDMTCHVDTDQVECCVQRKPHTRTVMLFVILDMKTWVDRLESSIWLLTNNLWLA
jgi:hypothetical protein